MGSFISSTKGAIKVQKPSALGSELPPPPIAPVVDQAKIDTDKATAAKILSLSQGKQSTILTPDNLGAPTVAKQTLLGGA